MNPVVHFEMSYEDKQRVADFYAQAFGWQSQFLGEEMGNYVVMTTSETDPDTRMVKQPGTINGGLYKRTREESKAPSVVIAVDDIRAAMKKVEASGGKIIGGKTPGEPDMIPGIGLYCSFYDTEGNRVSMLQPNPMN